MKKAISLLMVLILVLGIAACGQQPEEVKEWSRSGSFSDENENVLSISWTEEGTEPGWYVWAALNETMAGAVLPQEDSSLHGALKDWDTQEEVFTVTVSEEGEDGLLLQVEGGESYHMKPLPEPKIFVSVNTEGMGNVAAAEGKETPEVDPEYPFQSHQFNLAEPATYTFLAWPQTGYLFVKWQKDGQDFSYDAQITVELTESADFVAVFEEDPDWQNPVMNFVGNYQSGRARATVECWDKDEAWITIEWGGSAWELARWLIAGKLDTETLTIPYEGCSKYNVTYDDNGEVKNEEQVYGDGTGTIIFHDGGFTWHEDQSETGEDLDFVWVPVEPESESIGMANPWRVISEEEVLNFFTRPFAVPEGAENVEWSVMESPDVNPLLQLSFDLDGQHYTARMQATDDAEADISGMNYAWADEMERSLHNWAEGQLTAKCFRFVGGNEYDAELCTWFDPATGFSYAVGVRSEDLDGFDLLAMAEQMCPAE